MDHVLETLDADKNTISTKTTMKQQNESYKRTGKGAF